jgi:crossover junction endodeoxyribonuclease RuvC
MNLLGIDPGLNSMGYGVIRVNGPTIGLLEGGIIKGGSASVHLPQRLLLLYNGISEVISEYRPEAVALENIYSHHSYPNTAVLMGHARGVVCLACAEKDIPVFDYAATKIKLAITGSGRASKLQIQKSVQARLSLKNIPNPNDVSDALALAICHWQTWLMQDV